MAQQKITLRSGAGADSRRVLDVLTPVTEAGAPAVNATYLGQVYINQTNGDIYMSVAVGSETKANDWVKMVPVTALTSAIDAIKPLSAAGAPAVNATFLGQLYINTTNADTYVAKAVGSATKANDWQKITIAA